MTYLKTTSPKDSKSLPSQEEVREMDYDEQYEQLEAFTQKPFNLEEKENVAAFLYCFAIKVTWGDDQRASKLLHKLISTGYTGEAKAQLFAMYDIGWKISEQIKTPEQALRLLHEAATEGSCTAQNDLASMYDATYPYSTTRNEYSIVKDAKQVFHWSHQAASQEDAWGQYRLGRCYHEGIGTVKDLDLAYRWYRKVIEKFQDKPKLSSEDATLKKTVQKALSDLALNSEERLNTELKKAITRCQSRENNVEARLSLGLCYEHGIGVTKNLGRAMDYYLSAEKQVVADLKNATGNKDQTKKLLKQKEGIQRTIEHVNRQKLKKDQESFIPPGNNPADRRKDTSSTDLRKDKSPQTSSISIGFHPYAFYPPKIEKGVASIAAAEEVITKTPEVNLKRG